MQSVFRLRSVSKVCDVSIRVKDLSGEPETSEDVNDSNSIIQQCKLHEL